MSAMAGEDEQNNDENLGFPYEIKDLDPVLTALVRHIRPTSVINYVQVGPKNWFLPKKFEDDAKFYYNFKLRPNDVFVISLPRSGTTWTQQMIWLLCNNLDYKTAADIRLVDRFPFLELTSITSKGNSPPVWKILNQQSYDKRRFIKTHLPLELLPPNLLQSGSKVVYVARNPKDMVVSYYHFTNSIIKFNGDFSDMWSLAQQGLINWTPYWEHVKEAWNKKNESNLMFIFYEDMIKDLMGTLQKLAAFFGQTYTNEQLEELAEHLKFDNFKNNKSIDMLKAMQFEPEDDENKRFVRKGKMDTWKEYFNEDLEKKADEWIADNLKDSNLRFPIQISEMI